MARHDSTGLLIYSDPAKQTAPAEIVAKLPSEGQPKVELVWLDGNFGPVAAARVEDGKLILSRPSSELKRRSILEWSSFR